MALSGEKAWLLMRHGFGNRVSRTVLRPLLGPGMRVVVDVLKLSVGELCITLRGREAFVAKQLLDRAEVGAFFEQMGAEGVTQRMGVDVRGKAALDCQALNDAGDAPGGEARFSSRGRETAQAQWFVHGLFA